MWRKCGVGIIRSCALLLLSVSLAAQPTRLPRAEVQQIITAVLRNVAPPETRLSNYTIGERGLLFDHVTTMTEFGYADDAGAFIDPGLSMPIGEAYREMLADCSQTGALPCIWLGDRVYASIRPERTSRSEAVVWLHLGWASHLPARVLQGKTIPARTFFSGTSIEVFLTRTRSGRWQFARTGMAAVGL